VDADDHAFVERVAGLDEHPAAVVELAERTRYRLAVVLADQHAVLAAFDFALVSLVAVEDVADEATAAGQVQELVRLVERLRLCRHAGQPAAESQCSGDPRFSRRVTSGAMTLESLSR